MRILFLTDKHLDYVGDLLYIGLSRVLGDDQVVDYPYKPAFHDPESRPWYLVQQPGRRFTREEILDRLRDRYFNLVCLASFRQEAVEECARLYDHVPFPPMVFVDGQDDPKIRHNIVERFPIRMYFKREYVWKARRLLRDLGSLAWTFRGNRKLFDRTVPMPMSIVMDTLPKLGPVSKEIDVSYRGRASHPRRVKAVEMLSRMEGIRFVGGVYASPDDRKYKLKAGTFKRLWTKVLDNAPAAEADQLLKREPEAYYREIAASRMAVSLRGGGWMTPRYFEIVAIGTMLIADRPEILIPSDFIDRRHAVFCKPDLSDLEPLVRRYLREDAEREAIAAEGQTHLLKYHTCERRAEYFLDMCAKSI